ncbi:MAG: tetratricopeptide repeat protein [Candidatus Solibacter usitatus]|nr:tetratricopeptide repeat protein [Candidatus Solibacter usitatus]
MSLLVNRLTFIPLLALALPASCFAQKKEIVELGRDLALLQEEVRSNAKAQSDRLAGIEATLKAIQDQIATTSRALTVLDSGLKDRMEKSMATPLSGVSGKVDNLAQDFGYIRESVDEVNTRLGKLDQRVADLTNVIKTMQAPPAPPPPAETAKGCPAPAPAGITASGLYQDALRDKSGGNLELSVKGFTDYLCWFGDTDLAPNAQYYIGEILYNQKQYDQAIPAFDKVLEAYPKNAKTADSHLMKGRALNKLDRRSEAEKEFRACISLAPNSDAANWARSELKGMGLSVSPRAPAKRRP